MRTRIIVSVLRRTAGAMQGIFMDRGGPAVIRG